MISSFKHAVVTKKLYEIVNFLRVKLFHLFIIEFVSNSFLPFETFRRVLVGICGFYLVIALVVNKSRNTLFIQKLLIYFRLLKVETTINTFAVKDFYRRSWFTRNFLQDHYFGVSLIHPFNFFTVEALVVIVWAVTRRARGSAGTCRIMKLVYILFLTQLLV